MARWYSKIRLIIKIHCILSLLGKGCNFIDVRNTGKSSIQMPGADPNHCLCFTLQCVVKLFHEFQVEIVDDSFYEEEEVFTLNLHSEDMSVRIPNINRTRIVIEDDDSKSYCR